MSSEDRLARLGLGALKDDEAALEKALEEKARAYREKQKAWAEARDRKTTERPKAEKPPKG